MSAPKDPRDVVDQIAEHLRIEQSWGVDWVPVAPSVKAQATAVSDAGVATVAKAAAESETAGGAQTGEASKQSKTLPRVEPAVRTADPGLVEAAGASLEKIAAEIAKCKLCQLHLQRKKTVPGHGHPLPRVCFIGEGPGADEDATGLPFVGRAGQLLNKMIEAMGLRREEVFICNTVKCRPPGNRTPETSEMKACRPYLVRQLDIVRPEIIVALGRPAVQTILGVDSPLSRMRGRFSRFNGIPVLPTFHPAYLLRNPPAKTDAWTDLQMAHKRLMSQPDPADPAPGSPALPGLGGPPPQGSLFGGG